MKKYLVLGAVMTGFSAFTASAGDPQAECEQFAANNGIDAGPCACIVEAISGDAALLEEQSTLVTLADYENSSPELRAAVDPCIEA